MQFDTLEKKVYWYCKLEHLKNVTNWHHYTKATGDGNFKFWINAHTPTEKQSNQGWNTPIHLKNNAPHIKVPLIIWFLRIFGTEWNAHQMDILGKLFD